MERIESRQNEKVKRVVKLRSEGAAALPLFVVEGEKLLLEVTRSSHRIEQLFVLEGWSGDCPVGVSECWEVTAPVMEKLTGLACPSPVLAVCRMAPQERHGAFSSGVPWLVLDGVQDPGNVGTIFRSAEAFGQTPLVLLPPAVNPFQEKVLRAGAGSSLRLPHWRAESSELFLEQAETMGLTLWSLDARGEVTLEEIPCHGAHAFIVGNEGHGLSEALAHRIHRRVRIPMSGTVESLNAAVSASLLLYRLWSGRER